MTEPLPKHGGYRKLKSFQVAQLVYDVTARICDRTIDRRSRTHDQVVQAARSAVQNIAEGWEKGGHGGTAPADDDEIRLVMKSPRPPFSKGEIWDRRAGKGAPPLLVKKNTEASFQMSRPVGLAENG